MKTPENQGWNIGVKCVNKLCVVKFSCCLEAVELLLYEKKTYRKGCKNFFITMKLVGFPYRMVASG